MKTKDEHNITDFHRFYKERLNMLFPDFKRAENDWELEDKIYRDYAELCSENSIEGLSQPEYVELLRSG